ncbi:DUF222 domain-containing protein [Promicromonospora sp. NPDC057138]|uniref:HNH endonuclease signature motif containing protein n=1 Tax=Promicromonospora sp. NPDC057138 TaxID=3346031 RepID=UPI003637B1AE
MAANQCGGGGPRPVEDVLTDIESLLDELPGSVAPDTPEDGGLGSRGAVGVSRLVDASARLRVAGVRLDAVRWSVLPRIEAAGLWAQTGARTFAVWLARTEDVQTVTARAEVRMSRALRDHLPATLTAALSGRIGRDKVRALVDVATTSPERIEALGAPAVDVGLVEPSAPDDSATGESATDEPGMDELGTGGTDADDGDAPGPDDPTPADPTLEDLAVAGAAGVGSPTWEEQLLDWSTQNGPDRFRGLVRYFARHADPEADERGYSRAKDREYLDVSPTMGGYHVSGFLTEEHGLAVTTALGSVMGAPAPGDDRTPGQRRGQALADLARVVLDNGHTGTGASVRPHVSVTVSWTELQALATKNRITNRTTKRTTKNTMTGTATGTNQTGTTGTPGTTGPAGTPSSPNVPNVPNVKAPAVFTETGSPVPTSLLRRIACDSQVTRIVFGPDSQILDVGRAQRTITGQLRRAVIARDKHCVLGQCDQPPSRCEVHHAETHWADGGHTSAANAALLCYHHHDLVDTHHITMHYDNGWHFTDRHGQPIHTETDTTSR